MLGQFLNSISTLSSTLTNHGAPASFKFVIGAERGPFGVFTLFDGRAKNNLLPGSIPISMEKETISIFVHRKDNSPLGQNAMRKLISLRHPGIVKVLDSGETDQAIYIATEWVTPHMTDPIPPQGLFQIMTTLSFLHKDCQLVHGSLESSILVTATNSFKIGGFELARPSADLARDKTRFMNEKRDFSKKNSCTPPNLEEIDIVGFLLLTGFAPRGVPEICDPKTLAEWMNRNSDEILMKNFRTEFSNLKSMDFGDYTFFTSNKCVMFLKELESIHLKSELESTKLLSRLSVFLESEKVHAGPIMDLILSSVLSIPSLIPAAIPVIARMGIPKDSFQTLVEPKLLPLFQIQDRSVRLQLLLELPKLPFTDKQLEESIVPELCSGFTDSHPSIRENTLKALQTVHVSEQAVEKKLIPNFVKLLRDSEATIRTSAILGIAKLSSRLGYEKQLDVMNACIVAGLKDSFAPAKLAALAMIKSLELGSQRAVADCVKLFVPLVAILFMDNNPDVRQLAFETMDNCLLKVKNGVKNFCPILRDVTAVSSMSSSTRQQEVLPATISTRQQEGASRPFPAKPQQEVEYSVKYVPPKAVPLDSDFDSFWDDISKPPTSTKTAFSDTNSLI